MFSCICLSNIDVWFSMSVENVFIVFNYIAKLLKKKLWVLIWLEIISTANKFLGLYKKHLSQSFVYDTYVNVAVKVLDQINVCHHIISILMILKYVIEINIFNNFFLFFSTLVSEIFAKYCRYHYSVFLPIVVRLCSVCAS